MTTEHNPDRRPHAAADIGSFGEAAEFNNLCAGELVRPAMSPGLRPTFSSSTSPQVTWSTFFASTEPSFACYNLTGYDWYSYPVNGLAVHVPGPMVANVIATLPRLVATPVPLVPILPAGATREQWLDAGLDPDNQAPVWRFTDGLDAYVGVTLTGYEYEYTTNLAQQSARREQILPGNAVPFTDGQAVDPGIDFVSIIVRVQFIKLMDRAFPPGPYRFTLDLDIIPRAAAYQPSSEIPIEQAYRNRNLNALPVRNTTTITATVEVPSDLMLPSVTGVSPASGSPGTRVAIAGTRLDRTVRVTFFPGVPVDAVVVSDTLIEVIVPANAETGLVVVETRLGWIRIDQPFEVEANTLNLSSDSFVW